MVFKADVKVKPCHRLKQCYVDCPLGNGESMKEYKVFLPFSKTENGGENQKF